MSSAQTNIITFCYKQYCLLSYCNSTCILKVLHCFTYLSLGKLLFPSSLSQQALYNIPPNFLVWTFQKSPYKFSPSRWPALVFADNRQTILSQIQASSSILLNQKHWINLCSCLHKHVCTCFYSSFPQWSPLMSLEWQKAAIQNILTSTVKTKQFTGMMCFKNIWICQAQLASRHQCRKKLVFWQPEKK